MEGGMHWVMLPVQATSAAFQATHPGLANAKWLPTWRTRNTASPFMCARLPAPAGAMCVQRLSSGTPPDLVELHLAACAPSGNRQHPPAAHVTASCQVWPLP